MSPSTDTDSGGDPRVTTVVMTRDRRPALERSLPHHRGGIVLVDNGSTDGTAEWVRERFPAVDVVELDSNRGAVARNVGVSRTRTPYVAFADDDSWWSPDALTLIADLLDAHPRLALVAGRVLVGSAERQDPVCAAMTSSPLPRRPGFVGPPVLGFLACGAVVRREAFLSAGGFDPVVFFMGEEERLALDLRAAGWELCYRCDVVAHHHPAGSGPDASKLVRVERNRLLTAAMRRPWPIVARRWAAALSGDGISRRGAASAVRALPAALAARRPLPPAVEAERRLLPA